MLLFNFVSYVFLLCLCILAVMYVLFCIFCFHRANWKSSAALIEVFPCFFLGCKANARVTVGVIYSRAGNSVSVTINILFDGENISFDASLVI
jgi:hypothetical protein